MQEITQKAIKKLIGYIITILFSCVSMYSLFWLLFTTYSLIVNGGIQGKTTVHKAMNHNQYNIVIVSRANFDVWYFPPLRDMLLEVWLDDNKTRSYVLYAMDEGDKFSDRVKDVALLSDSGEVRVEFNGDQGYSPDGKSRTGVGLYKIVDD
jgi:hypothetical protein